jgi:uncharacterized protein YpuA (DUF1002 family)
MFKVSLGLLVFLLISILFNYIQHNKIKKIKMEYNQQEKSISDLKNQVDSIYKLKESAEKALSDVNLKTESNNKDYTKVRDSLNKLNKPICKKDIENVENKNSNNELNIVNHYYDILQSAYNLQN